MKRKTLIITGAVVATAAIILALRPLLAKEVPVTFETVKAERGTITNTVTATGTIQAIKTVQVGTQVSGIIQHVYVDFNDNVKQGQLLAKLDETPLRAQFEQSQAQVDMAQAQVNFQEATFKRLKVLYDKNLLAQSDYDQAVYNYEEARASLNNAKSALSRAKVNLDYATIYSPIDGVVLNRAVEEGQTVAASFNTPTLFNIVNDLTRMEVQTSVDEADIGKVKEGQRVEFTVDAYIDMSFNGTVSQVRLQPVTTNNVVTYVVILSAPNPDKKLRPGMTASTTIFVDEKTDALIIPAKATRFSPDAGWLKKMAAQGKERPLPPPALPSRDKTDKNTGSAGATPPELPLTAENTAQPSGTKTVWIRDENMMPRPVQITTGIDNGANIEVLAGLSEGAEIITAMNTGDKKQAEAAKSDSGPRGPFPF